MKRLVGDYRINSFVSVNERKRMCKYYFIEKCVHGILPFTKSWTSTFMDFVGTNVFDKEEDAREVLSLLIELSKANTEVRE